MEIKGGKASINLDYLILFFFFNISIIQMQMNAVLSLPELASCRGKWWQPKAGFVSNSGVGFT